MAFIRRIKKGKSVYLAEVKNYRDKGKVKQKVLRYLGKEFGKGKAFKKIYPHQIEIGYVKKYADSVVVDKLAKELLLDDILGEYSKEILLLVYSHLLETNLSISRIGEWVENTYLDNLLNIEKVSAKRIYRCLEYLSAIDFSKIEGSVYSILKEKTKFDEAVILDVTDTYLEDKNSFFSDKPRRGKDGKYKKLIQISLAINRTTGFPIFHKIYEGNISNIHILRDIAISLKANKINDFIVIDRGMSSKDNISFLEENGFRLICGLRRSKGLEEVVDGIEREDIYSCTHRIKLVNSTVYAKEVFYRSNRLIVVYNPSLEVIRREFVYEYKRREKKAKYLGYSFIWSNTSLDKEEIVRLYFEKEIIERSFKQMKGVLNLNPIRVWLKEHVIGHIRICYLAYCVLSLLSYYLRDLNISGARALEELKNSYIVNLCTQDGSFCSYRIILKNLHKKILDKLGVVYKM